MWVLSDIMIREQDLKTVVREMRKHFLVPAEPSEVFCDFDTVATTLREDYRPLADAFRHSLESVLSTASIPFALASASVRKAHFQRLHAAERIRALSIEAEAGSEVDVELVRAREAHRIACERMNEFEQSEEGRNAVILDICDFLVSGVKHGLEPAAQELLQQCVLLLWSALEVLFRDAFELYLNRNPGKTQALVSHPTTRKRFEAEKLPLGTVVEHGFDLSQHLGSVLVDQQDFSDLSIMKSVYFVLFPSFPELAAALAERNLWLLYQRRHLVVHRRGIVDQSYLDNTGETLAIGSRLSLNPSHFEGDLKLVVRVGKSLLGCLPKPQDAAQQ